MKILISVPHNKCPKDYHPNPDPSITDHTYAHGGHPCDFVAGPVAGLLAKKLRVKGHEVVVVYGNKLRHEEVDLNRPEGRDTEFRRKIDENIDGVALLLDCHSYPKSSAKYQRWEMIVMKSPNDKGILAKSFYQILINMGLNVLFSPGFTRDSVVNDYAKQGVPCFLVEHNEDIDIEMLTDFEVEAIDELLTGVKSKVGVMLRVIKESFKK